MSTDLQRHPLSAAFGDMPTDEFAELVADIKKNGLLQSIVYIRDEQDTKLVLDGWHRYRACIEAGVEPRLEPFDFVTEPATEQSGRTMTPAEFVIAQNAHRRHLSREQRRNIVVELLKAKPEASDRAIASMAKADHKTVGAVRREAEAGGEIPHLTKRVGRDGKRQPATTAQLAKPLPAKAIAEAMIKRHGRTNLLVSMGKLERVVADGVEVIAPPAETPKGARVAVDAQVVREATQPREVQVQVVREATQPREVQMQVKRQAQREASFPVEERPFAQTDAPPMAATDYVRVSTFDLATWAMRVGAVLEALEKFEPPEDDEGVRAEFADIAADELQGIVDHLNETTTLMETAIERAQATQTETREAA